MPFAPSTPVGASATVPVPPGGAASGSSGGGAGNGGGGGAAVAVLSDAVPTVALVAGGVVGERHAVPTNWVSRPPSLPG
ncbi:MAG TPA: hypothetical protein VFY82_15145 [Acidimicrobiales bacterium]|nr:hypothetical protein [Acidimicrobiales bacterium]